MGIFDRFPYSSTHEMNLDFMLGKATEIAESLQEIDTHKEQAEQAATNAAQSAASAAEQYQSAHGAAIRAEVAQGNAENAATSAGDAADRAEAASNLADEAVEQAQTAANGAIASAAAAETRINNLAASLPEDFTEINNDVTNLKSEWLSTKEPYKIPIKWRHGIININGATYLSIYGCITDYIIPTSLCDYITPLDTSYGIYIAYYNDSIGKPIFAIRTANINAVTNIDKNYPYFAIHIFKSWNDQITIEQCDSIVSLYTGITLNAKGIFEKLYNNKAILNKTDIWSICHQGYNEDTVGRNRKGGYALAATRGFTHGECDIKLTSDNKVVCCHDNTFIDATSGATITISTSTLAELQACDYYGTTIATLGEIIAECKMYGIKLVIDQFLVSNVEYACKVISEYNAWDMCILTIGYNNAQPESTSNMVEYIKANYNDNAIFAILSNDFSNYSNALAYAKTLNNAIFYIGQYLTNNFETLKTIASGINGKCKLMIWTVDNLTDINNALPYINGYCSNAWSGNDVFNPVLNNGM